VVLPRTGVQLLERQRLEHVDFLGFWYWFGRAFAGIDGRGYQWQFRGFGFPD
jgi:hypothetical protein